MNEHVCEVYVETGGCHHLSPIPEWMQPCIGLLDAVQPSFNRIAEYLKSGFPPYPEEQAYHDPIARKTLVRKRKAGKPWGEWTVL